MSKQEQNSRNKKIVNDLLKNISSNRLCADCNARGPQWASTTQGVFVCIRCAGLHRKLGTHISKVRSVGLDSWNDEQTRMVELFGNERANSVFEAKLDKEKPTADTDTALVEKFIRAKYERKVWIDKEAESKLYGNLESLGSSEESSPATTPTTPLKQSASQQNFQARKVSSQSNMRTVSSQDDVAATTTTSRQVNTSGRTISANTSSSSTPKITPPTNTPSLISFEDSNSRQDDLQQFIIMDNQSQQQSVNGNRNFSNGKDNVLAMFESPPIQPGRPPQQQQQPPQQMMNIPNGPPPLNNNQGMRMPPPLNNNNNGVRGMYPPPQQQQMYQQGPPPMMGRGGPMYQQPPPQNFNGMMNGPPPLNNNNGFMNGPPPLNNGFMNGPPPLNNGYMNGPPPMMMGRGYQQQPQPNFNNGMRF